MHGIVYSLAAEGIPITRATAACWLILQEAAPIMATMVYSLIRIMAAPITFLKLFLALCLAGVMAFVCAIVAEDKKPHFGTVITTGEDFVLCRFPLLSVVMGSASVVSLLLTILLGHVAVFQPYNNTKQPAAAAVPRLALFRSTTLLIFFLVAELVSASALVMLLGATVTQGRHGSGNVHQYQLLQVQADDDNTSCPSTPKLDGHFGGGALLALDAALMWFVCQLLALEARENYLDRHGDDEDDDGKKKKQDGRDGPVAFAAHA